LGKGLGLFSGFFIVIFKYIFKFAHDQAGSVGRIAEAWRFTEGMQAPGLVYCYSVLH